MAIGIARGQQQLRLKCLAEQVCLHVEEAAECLQALGNQLGVPEDKKTWR